jgi:hypothetical protein
LPHEIGQQISNRWSGELTRQHLNRAGNHFARELGMARSSVYRLLEEAATDWRFREVLAPKV